MAGVNGERPEEWKDGRENRRIERNKRNKVDSGRKGRRRRDGRMPRIKGGSEQIKGRLKKKGIGTNKRRIEKNIEIYQNRILGLNHFSDRFQCFF